MTQVKVTNMSLMRQVGWLLVAVVMLALAGAVAVNLHSARGAVQTQLRVNNSDNAQSLALALSQQHGDAQLIELLITAQFDTGSYRQIRLVRSDGSVAFERQAPPVQRRSPAWFARALPIESIPGVAQVSDGWRSIGQLEVISHVASAHDELWSGGARAAGLLGALGIVALALAAFGVRRIRRPLDATVAQADALVEGRYLQVDEPATPELARVARAMNGMVQRVQHLFAAQAAVVETLRRQAHEDALTGLSHRDHFLQRLGVEIEREDGAGSGVLVLLRLVDMAGINRTRGREVTDRALRSIGGVLAAWAAPGTLAGRLNGADFALAVPAPAQVADTSAALVERVRTALAGVGGALAVHVGAVDWQRGVAVGALLAQADLALARAEAGVAPAAAAGLPTQVAAGEREWHMQLSSAMAERRAYLVGYPVLDRNGTVWQLECPLRVQRVPGAEFEVAAQWLPLAARSRLLPQLDLHGVQLALQAIATDGIARGVNLALASLADGAFATQLRRALVAQPRAAALLGVEVGESAAVDEFALLQGFAAMVRPLGVRFGLEHAGHCLHRVDRLYELGLDYVKLDAALVRGVAYGDAARRFVTSSVALLHALGVTVCAEGIDEAVDVQTLWDCGIDAITGPWASAQPRGV